MMSSNKNLYRVMVENPGLSDFDMYVVAENMEEVNNKVFAFIRECCVFPEEKRIKDIKEIGNEKAECIFV